MLGSSSSLQLYTAGVLNLVLLRWTGIHISPLRFDFFARLGQFHDLHHELFRVNFGSLGTLDWVHGTGFHREAINSNESVDSAVPGHEKALKAE